MNLSNSLSSITAVFVCWKALLLVIVWCAPGQGYDTSTALLLGRNKLVRWDAIYFVQKAQRGDVFEQEWAFGKGISTLLGLTANDDLGTIASNGIILSHLTHYASTLLLWKIGTILNGSTPDAAQTTTLPFLAACLHIMSPAGIFLSAPYAESTFSCLNMLGFWLYLRAQGGNAGLSTAVRSCTIVAAGLSFGCATVVRSNGILSGLLFLWDAFIHLGDILMNFRQSILARSRLALLFATICGGLCIAIGLGLPQYLAYCEYCCIPERVVRPWCKSPLPLIYSFVQSHYWGVGFLRYWTLSNVPLFLLAVPSLALLLVSGFQPFSSSNVHVWHNKKERSMIRCLAVPQVVLALLAITNYHVQVITRLASGYPWHYLWLASRILRKSDHSQLVVRIMVMYGLIQAGLFACFLPPA